MWRAAGEQRIAAPRAEERSSDSPTRGRQTTLGLRSHRDNATSCSVYGCCDYVYRVAPSRNCCHHPLKQWPNLALPMRQIPRVSENGAAKQRPDCKPLKPFGMIRRYYDSSALQILLSIPLSLTQTPTLPLITVLPLTWLCLLGFL